MTWEVSTQFVQHCSATVPLSATLFLPQEDIGSTARCALANSLKAEQKPVRREGRKPGSVCFTETSAPQQPGGGTAVPASTVGTRSRSSEPPRAHQETPRTISNLFKAFESSHQISSSFLGGDHIFHPTAVVLMPDLLRCPALVLATKSSDKRGGRRGKSSLCKFY